MAPLPHNNTDLLYVDYNTGTVDHTMEVRFAAPATLEDALTSAAAFLDAVGPFLSTISILGARWQSEGTNVSVETEWTGAASYGSGTPDRQNEASFVAFVGRSAGGRRVRVAVFGCGLVNNLTTFRSPRSASPDIDAALTVLEAPDSVFYAIDGAAPSWKQYMNIGLSGYWQRQFR